MQIINETELMTNQKASQIIVPDKQFEALQTIEGNSLVFSIGTDNILFCTREVPGDTHGWVRVDMSTALSARFYNGAPVIAKTFDIAQDLSDINTIDIALVVTVNGTDELLLATGFSNTFDNWTSSAPSFVQYPFDDTQYNSKLKGLPINDVQITNGNGSRYIIADIISNATTQTISRYCIDTAKTGYNGQAWIPNPLAEDLEAGTITTLIGCGPNDGQEDGTNTGGFYVLGTIANEAQLQYYPAYVPKGLWLAPTRINIPSCADAAHAAIAVSASATNAPYTDLFFASNGSLYFLANLDQVDRLDGTFPTPTLIYTHSLFQDIQSIHIKNWNDNIVLWGQSAYTDPVTGEATGQLFIMEGVAGQETNAAAWSCPIQLLTNVVNSSAYINNIHSLDSSVDVNNGNAYGSCSVLFAEQVTKNTDGSYTSGLTQLFQDPITTAWQARSLLTAPGTDNVLTAIYETTSYTTHIRITDDNNMIQPFIPVSIWSSSPCSTYVNNIYSNLAFDAPLQTTTDESGIINIIQPVDTIGGISFNIAVQDPATKKWFQQVVNPLAVTMNNIKTQVPDGNDKSNYLNGNVTDEMGNSTPLTPNATATQQTTTTGSIYQFYTKGSTLNADGLTTDQEKAGGWPNPATVSVQATKSGSVGHAVPSSTGIKIKRYARPDRLAKNLRFNAATDKIWGCTFGKNARQFEGVEAMKEMGLVVHADGSMSLALSNGQVIGSNNWIEAKAGHLFKWMMSEAEKLELAIIQLGEDGLDCLLTIAGSIYHFVAKCANDIANAIHTMMSAIKTAFADLVKWIGSIFAWHDFINTHAVIKNLFVQYGQHCIDNIDQSISGITGLVDNVMGAIGNWADLPGDSGQSQSAGNNQDVGQHKPQNNWANHHIKNNASNSATNYAANQYSSAVQTLMGTVSKEGEILSDTLAKLKSIDITTISMADLVKQLIAIIADDVLQSIENILTSFLQLIGDIVQDIIDSLKNETITIPVISQLYQRYVGSPLSLLDVVCLVAAIPVTVIYKLLNKGDAPFAANDPLATATDYASLCQLCAGQSQVKAIAPGMLGFTYTPPQLNNRWYVLFFAGNVMALFGGSLIGIVGYMKTKNSSSKNLAIIYALSYFLYIGPDIVGNIPGMIEEDSRWFSVLNGALAAAGILKAFWDIKYVSAPADPAAPVPPGWFGNTTGLTGYGFISPFLDAVINGVWELPVVEAFTHSEKIANDIVDIVANTLFNASGVISPLVAFKVPPGDLAWAGVQTVLNILYGGGSMAESVDGQKIDPISLK